MKIRPTKRRLHEAQPLPSHGGRLNFQLSRNMMRVQEPHSEQGTAWLCLASDNELLAPVRAALYGMTSLVLV